MIPAADGKIRVFLADDQTLVREGIRALLALDPQIVIAGEAEDGEAAIRLIPQAGADVVLMDVRMPKKTGVQVIQTLQPLGTLPPTIILTTFDDDGVVLEGVKAGAKGFMLKDISFEELTAAIRTVAAGGNLIQLAAAERIVRGLAQNAQSIPGAELPEPLTERELEILRLLAGGFSNRELADALHLAEGTVKNHLSSILAKLGVRDRTRAVLKALERGLI